MVKWLDISLRPKEALLSEASSKFALDPKNPAGWLLHVRADSVEEFVEAINDLFNPEKGEREDLTNVVIQSFNPAIVAAMAAGQSVQEALGYEPDPLATAAYDALKAGATRAPRQTDNGGGSSQRSASSSSGGSDRGQPQWFVGQLDDDGGCIQCGSDDFWDNRPKIKSGEYSKKSPIFKCKNCDHAYWPPKESSSSRSGSRGD